MASDAGQARASKAPASSTTEGEKKMIPRPPPRPRASGARKAPEAESIEAVDAVSLPPTNDAEAGPANSRISLVDSRDSVSVEAKPSQAPAASEPPTSATDEPSAAAEANKPPQATETGSMSPKASESPTAEAASAASEPSLAKAEVSSEEASPDKPESGQQFVGSQADDEDEEGNPSGRQFDRFCVDLDVTVSSEHNFYAGFVENMSVGGIFIATHQLKEAGSVLDFTIHLPDGGEPIAGSGEVRWVRVYSETSNVPPGMGIRFNELAESEQQRIEAFLAEREPMFYDDED